MKKLTLMLFTACVFTFGLVSAQQPTVSNYGTGCSSQGTFNVENQIYIPTTKTWGPSLPQLTQTFGLAAPFTSADKFAFLLIGRQNKGWFGMPLPITVYWRQLLYPVTRKPEFAPCLLLGIDLLLAGIPTPTTSPEKWAMPMTIPNVPALVGAKLYFQWSIYYQKKMQPPLGAPIVTEEGFRWSNGLIGTIGK